MIHSKLHAPKKGEILPLEIRVYGNIESKYYLYDDDGESYDYEKGNYSWTELNVSRSKDGNFEGSVKRLDNKIYNYGNAEWYFMTR